MQDDMTMTEALAELAAVGAVVKSWTPMGRERMAPTLYVNGPRGEKLGEIRVSPGGYVSCASVWYAIRNHICTK